MDYFRFAVENARLQAMGGKELTYQTECGPDDILYTFVYEIEPYDPGYRYDKNGDGCPPSGGYASVYEVRNPDGSKLPHDSWESAGIDIERIEEAIYESACAKADDYDGPDRREED